MYRLTDRDSNDPRGTHLDDTPPATDEEIEAARWGCTLVEWREWQAWEAARDAELPTMRADYAEMADEGVWF